MTKQDQRAVVAALFEWMRLNQPNVYLGLVKRFTTPASSLGDFSETLSTFGGKVLDTATTFVNSSGFDKLLTAAQPFITSSLEKKQLEQQLRVAKAGYTTQTSETGARTLVPVVSSADAAAAAAAASSRPSFFDDDTMKWALIGGAGLATVLLLRGRS